MSRLKSLDLSSNPEITDQGLAHIARLTALTGLVLGGNPKITDAGVSHLASLQGLKDVGLIDTSITDEACKTLATLPLLESVHLDGTRISDAGLETLSTSNTLKLLTIAACKRISDQCLESLAKIGSLTELQIQNNPQLTEAAVRKLQDALPKCQIVSDFPNIAPPPTAAEMKPSADPDGAVPE
jgi:hypothetical protein